ncbi:MAG: hypothetical protein BWY77_01499 [bacterium ADurb.Bin431]|nr:MAG: hypothetical protein BWY77_01499 [bacterium ADurb.Bin431]
MGQGGDMQAAAGHQGEQSDCFESHGFAAGVRAADDDGVAVFAEEDIEGDDLLLPHAQHQQGVAAAGDMEQRLRDKFGRMGIEAAGKATLGVKKIEPGEQFEIGLDGGQGRAQQIGEMAQDPLHLPRLLGLEFADAVVVLY